MIHEDERRTLEDFPEGKLITAKQDCVIGKHYHKIKTEKFFYISGNITAIIDGIRIPMYYGYMLTVEPMERHSFEMGKDSKMIGLCSHSYDPTDDYKL